ncbi:uncharacterized protein J7T54_001017 [Emericellopsis cladophorae]|uniref:Uncharacterized protein n=1 Tax=Emericellopsis cladophorae TaxID=2686198 RepID=A0A9Q0BBG3_9HYPO|nr:uncharacterized protein J7T54_001017 [Emericellopsis cladophorae]KAI6779287.1 hypothetical protein J7T54_001017 [Emericellopsis cladophorae]
MSSVANELPYSLRQQMSRPEERAGFEGWWNQSSFSDSAAGRLAEPVHDLGVASVIDEKDKASLKEAIEQYLHLEQPGQSSFFVDFNLDECSWEQVFDEVWHAKEVYEKKATRNPFRRCLRHGHGFQRNVKPLTEAVPGENGMGLIKGAMQIVLNAVQRRTVTCEKIFELFESIPRCVRHAECLQDIHRNNHALNIALRDLYLALVRCLPSLIRILLREEPHSPLKKLSNTFLKDSAAQVDQLLLPVKQSEARLEECQRELLSQGVVQTVELSHISLEKHDATREQLELVTRKLTEVQETQTNLPNALKDTLETFKTTLHNEFVQHMKNHVYIVVQDQIRMNTFFQAQAQQAAAYISSPRTDPRMDLLESLCDSRERAAPAEDRASVLRKYHQFKAKALARANQLMSNARFGEWVGVLHSDIILVNGHSGGDTIGSTSPLSVFCAGLTDTFGAPGQNSLPQSPFIIVEFFCGHHATESSGLEGPQGMMRSLISQALCQWPGNVPLNLQPRRHENFSEAHGWSLSALCELFETIICQLPRELPVWCIIDNISYFETSLDGWDQELEVIVASFERFVHVGKRTGAISAPVKILLAAGSRSLHIWDMLPSDAEINIRDGGVFARTHGLDSFRSSLLGE